MYIDHVNIKATAELLEKVRDFYCTVLGLKAGQRPAFREHGYWLYSGEQAIVHLSECSRDRDQANHSAFDHFALKVPDLSVIAGRLEDAGIEFHQSLVPGTGLQQLFFTDPSGTRVEVQGPALDP